MVKPIGPICNLDCQYCYYLEKEDLYPGVSRWRMPEETLERYIRQHIAAYPAGIPEIHFSWQGGEPTLMGLDFFRRVVELQQEHCPPGVKATNSFQTNGTLLDDEWATFFQENDFLIGLSLDGPGELTDAYRVDKEGLPTFKRVMAGLRLLQQHQVQYNVLCTVHAANQHFGRRVYQFFRGQSIEFIQFIPIVERIGSSDQASDRSVESAQFGRFLAEVFDEWVRNDVGRVYVQTFEETLRCLMGGTEGLCVFNKTCGDALAMEHNGDLYSCDHFVTPDYKLGNVRETPLLEILNQPEQKKFGQDKFDTLPNYCLECDYLKYCYGECPKNRFIETPDGQPGLNYLCAGLKTYFAHTMPYFRMMGDLLRAGKPPADIMQAFRSTRRSKPPARRGASAMGPNDPCPCGSGRKFKRCCMSVRRQPR
jgi:uncharacterized protein